MAHYLVRATPVVGRLAELRRRLTAGEIRRLRPFGPALDASLRRARLQPDGTAVWEEEDYCTPPLAQERAAVLDAHFTGIRVEPVPPSDGWARIGDLPSLWTLLDSPPPS